MSFQYEALTIQHYNKSILIVTMQRPEVKNAINAIMIRDFLHLWSRLTSDPGDIRCVILTGQDDAFSAGADLKERKHYTIEQWKLQLNDLRRSVLSMMDCPVPIISAVNGVAFGGGLELVLASDFAFASDNALFAQSEAKWGIIPGALGTQNLPKTCGLKRAKELIFTAMPFNAEQALAWNIVNKVVAPGQLRREILTTAEKICDNAPLAIRQAKAALNAAFALNQQDAFQKEMFCYEKALMTKDREEGMNAFHAKRKPHFHGE